jgi:hypothetical protein
MPVQKFHTLARSSFQPLLFAPPPPPLPLHVVAPTPLRCTLLHARRIRCPPSHGCRGRRRKERPAAAGRQQRQCCPPRPQQRSNGGGQIIAPPLPRDIRDWVVPAPLAPPPVDVRNPGVHPPRAPACCVRPPRVRSCPRCPPRCLLAKTVAAGSTAKNAPPLPSGGNGDAVLPATNNRLTTAVELLRRRSPARSTIGASLLRRRLLLSTSAVPSLPRPHSSCAWADNSGQIIAPPLPREVHDRVIPPPPAPPPVDVCSTVLAAPPLIACMG